jgi:hypothetical protein
MFRPRAHRPESGGRRAAWRPALLLLAWAAAVQPAAAQLKAPDVGKVAGRVAWAKRIQQGFNLRLWMDSQLLMGNQATVSPTAIGLDYPAGSNVEHLFGGGPVIGGLVNGARRVSAAYWEGVQEFGPDARDSARDRMWVVSAGDTLLNPGMRGFYKRMMSIRGVDDDGDGKVDEDDLDGTDNDGDWNPVTDDIGADGIPDSLESGCGGAYNPSTNPDPAYDNYEPSKLDICHPDGNGNYVRKGNRDIYTEKNRISDHGEPHVDEDYGAISDQDIYTSATDTFTIPPVSSILPLNVKVIEKTYAFRAPDFDAILPVEFFFVNIGTVPIENVYLGWTGDLDVGPTSAGDYATNNYSGYLPDVHTAYVHDAVHRGATPLGVTVLGSSRRLDSVNFTYRWWEGGQTVQLDSPMYSWMSCQAFAPVCIEPDQPPTSPADMRMMIAFGPVGDLLPGDTVKMALALVSGTGIESGPSAMHENARTAIRYYANGFRQPVRPVSPCLEIIPGDKSVAIRWGRTVPCANGQPGVDPLSIWDDSNHIAESYPPDHWRRVNPPAGHVHGGRIFEGFRLYRSDDPDGALNTFTLLKQYDLDDEFPYNTGFDSLFVDTNLIRGHRYYYAVTSFGIPDRTISVRSEGGVTRYDTLYSPEPESPISTNSTSVDLTFAASQQLGAVLAVPNPYRVDQDYTFENGGWEGRGAKWTEENRQIKFIHLPPVCTIRVFTLAGDVVTTIRHDDPVRGEESWDILSENYRALASGVYIFTVESDFGTQIGKFVLIR